MSHSTEGPVMGAALGKFDSSNSNERFLTNVYKHKDCENKNLRASRT